MASSKIDELQIQISSDASTAITQLNNLADALDRAASSATSLSRANGDLNNFASGLERIAGVNLTSAIANLKELANIDLKNLKDKKINIDISVSGADRLDRLRYAASQAERDIGKSVTEMGKTLGKDLGMNTTGIQNVKTILHDMTHDMANGGDGAEGMERLKDAIHNSATVATADLTGMRDAYVRFLKDVETLRINPGQISKDETAEWKKLGLERLLKKGGQRIDTDVFGFDSAFVKGNSDIIDFFTLPQDAPDQFVFLRQKIVEAQQALSGFTETDAVTEKISQMAETVTAKLRGMMEVMTSKHMTDSADKIPIDLKIDQTRFEKQIQDAINAATGKTYNTKPIKLNIDQQQLRNNVQAAFALVDIAKLPQYAKGFTDVSNAISTMNQTNLKSTGINQFTNAMRRLMMVDTSKFDVTTFAIITDTIKSMSKLGGIDKTISRFVSAMTKLSETGYKSKLVADGLKKLGPVLEDTVKRFINIGTIDGKINQFIVGLSSLANAGQTTGVTAQNLDVLSKAVMRFLKSLRNAPQISTNLAMTIQGLGNLAAAGQKTSKALSQVSNAGTKTGGILHSGFASAAKSVVNDLKRLLNVSIKLGASGARGLGSFMQKLGLIPSSSSGIDRTALSFTNLLRAVLPFYGIRGLFDWGKSAFEAGSAITEVENVINTSFGSLKKGYEDISGYIYRWAKDTTDAFGVSEIAAKQYAGRLMAMFNSSGFDLTEGMRDSAAKMTTDLIERAGDVASFYDIGVDEAMTKFQAGLAGQVRPLRALGINMSVANMEAFAMSQGINTAWKEMDQASQMALRYQYILYATQYAEGDFGRTSMSAANQVRLLQLNVQMLNTTIGQGLISAIAPVISWLNALIKRLIQAANAFRVFMWTLFGKPLAAAKGVVNDLAGYLDDASDSASGLGDAGGGASDGLGGASDAAKELKKNLSVLPFDELNQLAKDTSSASSGGSGGSGGGGGVSGLGDLGLTDLGDIDIDSSPTVEAINRWAARIHEAFEKGQWSNLGRIVAEGINDGFKFIYDVLDWENIKPRVVDKFIIPFQTTFNSMAAWIDWTLVGNTFGRGLNDITYILRAWITGVEWREYGGYLAEGLNSMINTWDADAFGRLIADKFKAAWDFFGGWVETFNFASLGSKLKIGFTSFLDELDSVDMGETLAEFLNGISTTIINFLQDGTVRDDIANEFSSFINSFLESFDEEDAKEALSLLSSTLTGAVWKAIGDIDKSQLVEKLKETLSGLDWGIIGTAIAIKAAGSLAYSLFGALFKIAAKEAITKTLGGLTLGQIALGGATITAAVLAIGAITIGGIALGEWIKKNGWGQLNTEGNKQNAANQFSQGQTRNQQILQSSGQNAAGYNTSIQTKTINASPAASSTPSNIKQFIETIFTAKEEKSYINATKSRAAMIDTPFAKTILDGEMTAGFKEVLKNYLGIEDETVLKTANGKTTSSFNTTREWYHGIFDNTALKTANGKTTSEFNNTRTLYHGIFDNIAVKTANAVRTGEFNNTRSLYHGIASNTATKTANGFMNSEFLKTNGYYHDLYSNTATKTADGETTWDFRDVKGQYDDLGDKWVTAHVDVDIDTAVTEVVADIQGAAERVVASFWTRKNAKGGLFTGATGLQVFGEAGAEAAIPLERKSTMKRIANAIVNTGEMTTSNSQDVAEAIAARILPALSSMIANNNERPLNINATLYTEDNEVLARAVNQGNRSLDKRYHPVAQYNY